ncbi:hypothetical protein [Streptomyces sp. NPDC005799]
MRYEVSVSKIGFPEYGEDGRVLDVADWKPTAASTLSQFWPRSWV